MICIFLSDLTCFMEEEKLRMGVRASSPMRRKMAEHYRNLPDQARCIGAGLLIEKGVRMFRDRFAPVMSREDTAYETSDNMIKLIPVDMNDCLKLIKGKDSLSGEENEFSYLDLRYEKNGRPFLDGEGTVSENGAGAVPYISVTHSGHFAAVGVAAKRIGIDIEHRRKISPGIAKKILTYAEFEIYQEKTWEDAQAYLLEKWTQKEAAAKLDGSGVFQLLPDLSDEGWYEKKGISLQTFGAADGYVLSVAYQ